jgi:hypothetical protein
MKNETVSQDRCLGCPYLEFQARARYKEERFPDRRVKSCLLVFVQAWLSSWPCGHVAAGLTWCYYAGHGSTLAMVIVLQLSCVMRCLS